MARGDARARRTSARRAVRAGGVGAAGRRRRNPGGLAQPRRPQRVNITAVDVVDDVASTGADVLADAVGNAIAERGRCTLALSRGSTMFRRLAAGCRQWEVVDVSQVDERAAPDGAAERNRSSA